MGKLKHLLVLDFESYYDTTYSLRTLSTPEYILDPRFEVHLLAAFDVTWDAPRIINAAEIPDFLAQYPPDATACCGHNMLFDGAILSWRYGWVPARLIDTLGMARALRSYPRYSLGAVAKELFGYDSKGSALGKVKGLSAQGIKNAGLWPEYQSYAMQDARICMQIYLKLASEFPPEEAKVMDLVLRCAVEPVLHANVPLLETHLGELRRKKQRLLNDCGFGKAALMSTAQFQQALESLGVEIKTKISAAGREVPQFAKSDPFMEELLEYAESENDDVNYQVQTLAAARLSFKSTIEETRAERFLNIAQLPWDHGQGTAAVGIARKSAANLLPVALRYSAAHTHRLGGEWKLNLQNLPRDKTKSKLRQALMAPPGHKLITADLSQIEARIVAVLAKQHDLIESFRAGRDVYADFGTRLFGKPVSKTTTPNERWIAKTAILGLGYGCGAERFNRMVTTSARQYAIPLEGLFSREIAEKIVNFYRSVFPNIPQTWYLLDRYLQNNINGGNANPATWGPVQFSAGKITLPNGLTLRYQPNDQHLYGAKLLENISQALARIVLMQAAVRLVRQGYRFIHQGHDELTFAIPDERVSVACEVIKYEMTVPPNWLPDLPLAVELGVGENYGNTKS